MKLTIDTDTNILSVEEHDKSRTIDLYSREAFEQLSNQWIRIGWNQKYQYTFSWMGRPVIQLPEDMIRAQEVIYQVRPDVIIETGVAHGGSLIYYASLCKAMDRGKVIGIDIEIRPHNRNAIEAHELSSYITLIEGGSTDTATINQVKGLIGESDTVMVLLDSNHTREHVANELEAYHELVTLGSYIVATDGVMQDLHDVPRGEAAWKNDNPSMAALKFEQQHPEFSIEQPEWPFNESELQKNITHWPGSWLKRID